jgi:hypothetical protein
MVRHPWLERMLPIAKSVTNDRTGITVKTDA